MKSAIPLILLLVMLLSPPASAGEGLMRADLTQGGEQAEDVELVLTLTSAAEKFSRGAAIDVIVTILNADTSYWVIPPGVILTSGDHWPQPWMELEFLIVDEHRRGVYYIGTPRCSKLRILPPSSFLVLLPNYFYGRKISLNREPFFYDITDPGRYKITARLKISARSWLDHLSSEEDLKAETLPYDIGRAFEGELKSQEIEITVHR